MNSFNEDKTKSPLLFHTVVTSCCERILEARGIVKHLLLSADDWPLVRRRRCTIDNRLVCGSCRHCWLMLD